jgi:hypothetical protein
MRAHAAMSASGVRRIGVATLVALLLAVLAAWHGVAFVGNPTADSLGSGTLLWLMIDLLGAALGCGLAVVYLRHLHRDPAAPANRSTWTLLILLLGPFAMPFYWRLYMRAAPPSPWRTVQAGLVTEEEARLLASVSVAPPGPRDTP